MLIALQMRMFDFTSLAAPALETHTYVQMSKSRRSIDDSLSINRTRATRTSGTYIDPALRGPQAKPVAAKRRDRPRGTAARG